MEKENMRSLSSMAREIPTTVEEVIKVLWDLGYIEKDELKQRMWTLSEKGMEHGKYRCIAVPVFDETVFDEIKDHVEKKKPDPINVCMEKAIEETGREVPASEFFARKGLRKIHGERLPLTIALIAYFDEADFLLAALVIELLNIDDKGNIVVADENQESGVREERNI
nr:hypothetical protein [Clostridia bacterium]